jgi:hypothetical protein
MQEERKKIICKELKKVIDELGQQGLFEEEILKDLYMDLSTGPKGLYVQAEFDYKNHKSQTLKALVDGMIEFCDNGDEDCSGELWQAAAELEGLAKVCAGAAERHAAEGPRVHAGHWPLK